MKKLFLFSFIYLASSFYVSAQKSKIVGVFQLIENEKYEEAKTIIEEATKKKSTRNWPRTWYARGLLCQNAYRAGMDKKKENLYNLYSDQLYVAFSSFEESRFLDKRGRYDKILAPRYVLLANDLMKVGEKDFSNEKYDESLRAFQYALRINKSSFLNLQLDTSLLYNTAISAYKSKNWDDAIKYLKELNEYKYSTNVPHLLYSVYMNMSDTTSARNVLINSINKYKDNEELVLLLADLSFNKTAPRKAVGILNNAFSKDTSNYIYPYTKGLIYQRTEDYKKAINAFNIALGLPSDTLKVYMGIGTCYYNMGAVIDEKARAITNNAEYLAEKEKSNAAFESAIIWFEKAYKFDNQNQEVISKLNLLYSTLGKRDKMINTESTSQ